VINYYFNYRNGTERFEVTGLQSRTMKKWYLRIGVQ